MDKRLVLALVLLAAGIVHLVLPVYFTMTGLVLCALGLGVLAVMALEKRGNRGLRDALTALMGCCVIGLVICMSIIMGCSVSDWDSAEQADYAIVLGCQVRADGEPSRALSARIDTAAELLEQNPTVTVIVSGGKGTDENISEAQCMYNVLVAKYPQWADRILLEDRSTTTRENLLYCAEIIEDLGGTDQPVTLVTSEYHMARAVYLAGRQGLAVTGVTSTTWPYVFRFNYYLREVFAFVKAFFVTA